MIIRLDIFTALVEATSAVSRLILLIALSDELVQLDLAVAAHVEDIVGDSECFLLLLGFLLLLLVYLADELQI